MVVTRVTNDSSVFADKYFDELSLGHIPTSLSRSTGRRVPQMGGLHVQLMGDTVKLLVIGMQEWEDAKCEI